jgi:hypothetical protein
LISLNASPQGNALLSACGLHFSILGFNAMIGHQQDEIASQSAAPANVRKADGKQAKQEKQVQDMLEDDDVREALRLLHAQKTGSGEPA